MMATEEKKRELEEDMENLLFYGGPEAAASALFSRDDVDKTALGEYLGKNKTENKAVLAAYVSMFDFSQLDVDAALRVFLRKFRLPGEAQVIDRLMSAFAAHYASGGAGAAAFRSADTAYVLAFSIIMLNTDLHSPRVVRKMTREQFIKNNRGIDAGQDLPREYLEGVYERIAAEEITIDVDTGGRCGYMTKQGGRIKTWKRRWFMLRGQDLFYYRTPQDREPLGVLPLRNLSVGRCAQPLTLVLRQMPVPGAHAGIETSRGTGGKKITKSHRTTFMLACDSTEDMSAWAAALADAVQPSLCLLTTLQAAVTESQKQQKSKPQRQQSMEVKNRRMNILAGMLQQTQASPAAAPTDLEPMSELSTYSECDGGDPDSGSEADAPSSLSPPVARPPVKRTPPPLPPPRRSNLALLSQNIEEMQVGPESSQAPQVVEEKGDSAPHEVPSEVSSFATELGDQSAAEDGKGMTDVGTGEEDNGKDEVDEEEEPELLDQSCAEQTEIVGSAVAVATDAEDAKEPVGVAVAEGFKESVEERGRPPITQPLPVPRQKPLPAPPARQ